MDCQDIELFLDNRDGYANYLPKSILNAANFVSTFWLEQYQKKKDFAEILYKKRNFIQNKVLKRKD
jgi:hypothetical protein